MNTEELTAAVRHTVTAHRDALDVAPAPLPALRRRRREVRRRRLAAAGAVCVAAAAAVVGMVALDAPERGAVPPAVRPAPDGTVAVAVPSVVGLAADDALAVLRAAGLQGRLLAGPGSSPGGTVVAQSVAAGATVDAGAVVDLRVARTP